MMPAERQGAWRKATVRGTSMDKADIQPGDVAIFELGVAPHSGQVVAASIEGKEVIKRYRETVAADGRRVAWLMSESSDPRWMPHPVGENTRIVGVVRAIQYEGKGEYDYDLSPREHVRTPRPERKGLERAPGPGRRWLSYSQALDEVDWPIPQAPPLELPEPRLRFVPREPVPGMPNLPPFAAFLIEMQSMCLEVPAFEFYAAVGLTDFDVDLVAGGWVPEWKVLTQIAVRLTQVTGFALTSRHMRGFVAPGGSKNPPFFVT